MLKRFNINNFLSFNTPGEGNPKELCMSPGKVRRQEDHLFDDGNTKILKFAAIYGANASGKSNLVKAMSFMRTTILSGLPFGCSKLYCRTDEANKDKESYFEVELSLNGKCYAYGFEAILSKRKFTAEWLYELKKDSDEIVIFSRDISKNENQIGSLFKDDKNLYKKFSSYIEDINDESLLLTMMNKGLSNFFLEYKQASILKSIYLWFLVSFDIHLHNPTISNFSYFSDQAKLLQAEKILSSLSTTNFRFEIVKTSFSDILSKLPDDIKELLIMEKEKLIIQKEQNPNINLDLSLRTGNSFYIIKMTSEESECLRIKFVHNNTSFDFDEESDGTIRLLDLIEIFFAPPGKTFVIDELDRCMHPSLSCQYIKQFFEITRQKDIQLIVTTHESRLLDFDLIRRDEVWFLNKDKNGNSDIYSLDEFNERFDKKIDKAYLEGRYGGAPIFSVAPLVFTNKEN